MEARRNWRSGRPGDKYQRNRKNPNRESEIIDYQQIINACCLPEAIVDRYMGLVTKYSLNRVYAFNTSFFTAFSDHGYSRIHRWTKKTDIFSRERLFIPIYSQLSSTWNFAIVNFSDQSIRFYNTIGRGMRDNTRYQQLILKYLKLEYFTKKRRYLCTNSYTFYNYDGLDHGFEFSDSGLIMCIAARHFGSRTLMGMNTMLSPSRYLGTQLHAKDQVLYHVTRDSIS